MNKAQLIDSIAAETGMSKKDTEAFIDSFVSTVKNSVQRGDDVQLVGFGAFKRVAKSARKCRNPLTGDIIKVPAKKVVKFYPGKAFADQVNSKTTAKKPAAKKTTSKKPATTTKKTASSKKPTSKKTVAKTSAKKPAKKATTKKK